MSRHSIIRHIPNTENEHRGPDMLYIVDLYEHDKLLESRRLPNKSIHYAKDVSENWDNGIIKLENN